MKTLVTRVYHRGTLSLMQYMAWAAFVNDLTEGETQLVVAGKAGVSQPTVGRWRRGTIRPTNATTVIRFARVYNANVAEALVAAGMLTWDEFGLQPPIKLDDVDLAALERALRKRRKKSAEDHNEPPADDVGTA